MPHSPVEWATSVALIFPAKAFIPCMSEELRFLLNLMGEGRLVCNIMK
jgi:hypothetical protein